VLPFCHAQRQVWQLAASVAIFLIATCARTIWARATFYR
jgi:hypothetical protein